MIAISSGPWVDGDRIFVGLKVKLDDLDDIVLIKDDASWFYLEDIPVIIDLLSEDIDQIIIYCVFSYQVRNLHLFKCFFFLLLLLKKTTEYLVFTFIKFRCLASKRFTFGVLIDFSLIDKLTFGDDFKAGINVTSFSPNAVWFDMSCCLNFLLGLPKVVLVMSHNQGHYYEIWNSFSCLFTVGGIVDNFINEVGLECWNSLLGCFDDPII